MAELHVIPLNDERAHELVAGCACKPRVLWLDPDTGMPWASGDHMVVHNAFDCRECCEVITNECVEPGKNWKVVWGGE